jgi:AcrR family transcriptional regulator
MKARRPHPCANVTQPAHGCKTTAVRFSVRWVLVEALGLTRWFTSVYCDQSAKGQATMTRAATRTPTENPALKKGRKSTQHERLLAGMVTTANREGYARVSVSKVIGAAGVSRPTFYEHFHDKDDCFLAALADTQRRLLADVRRAVADSRPERALAASVRALLEFARNEPAHALFVTSQAMAAGPRALDVRDQGLAEIEQVVEDAHSQASPASHIPDVSTRIVIGGIYRLLAARLRNGELWLSRALGELTSWIESYEQPAAARRWRSLEPTTPATAPTTPIWGLLTSPTPLGAGRPDLSKEEVAANHRQRILYAAARLAENKGYNATTVADITTQAGVDGRAFYSAFADKQDAFMAVHELGVQQVMSATASAFFTGASWPERIWAAGGAFAGFLQSNPMIAHVGFVEAYAVGPAAVQRVQDSHVAFTIFLQEGYQHEPARTPPSRLVLEAIITTVFEIVYRQARTGEDPHLTGVLGHIVFMVLPPFLGAAEANRFIQERLKQ